MNSVSAFALVSIFLYASLAVTCLYFALTFYDFKRGEFCGGRYSAPKFAFFTILCISAILDIPLFIGCIAENGPTDCEWDAPSYVVFWLFHVLATCGYVYAIITPAVLWSDIIHQKDGNFLNSAYPPDTTKIFLRVAFGLFCANEVATVIGAIICIDPHDPGSFGDSPVGAITDLLTPILTTVITFGCLWSGIELQRYVMQVGLGGGTRNRVLMQLNLTMFLIAATYMYRALLVLSLYEAMPHEYKDAMHVIRSSFFLWLLGTRWLPAVVCSFCLVNEMRFQSSAQSQGTLSRSSKEDPGEHTLYQSLLRAVGVSGGRNSTVNTNDSTSSTYSASPHTNNKKINSNHHNANTRNHSIESRSTNDSVLEGSYSMLSSVDFPDSCSDTSSTYITSPFGSPERREREEKARLLNRSVDGTGTSRGQVSQREAERISRKHRKSMQQLNASTSSSSNNNNNNNPTHPAASSASSSSSSLANSLPVRRYPHAFGHDHIPAIAAYGDSPQLSLSRAESGASGGSDNDFLVSYSPSRNSIDHFFTFAAPNLNLSNIGGGGDWSGVPVSHNNARMMPVSGSGPAHIQHTINADHNAHSAATTHPDMNNNNRASNNPAFVAASPPRYYAAGINAGAVPSSASPHSLPVHEEGRNVPFSAAQADIESRL